MHCPFCQKEDTKVIDSRLMDEGQVIRRRRECGHCQDRFSTHEKAELELPKIVKRDGKRSSFDVKKLRAGMAAALEKRPVAAEDLETAVLHILHAVRTAGEREIRSQWLGELAMQQLRLLDGVAYVRFASIYRSFEDVEAFSEEIKRFKQADQKHLHNEEEI